MEKNKSITFNDLPVEIQIDSPKKSNNFFITVLIFAGIIFTGLGVLVLLAGPDVIYYDALYGMTFTQMIQAYPGLITSIGVFLLISANQLANYMDNKNAKFIKEQLADQIIIDDSDIPEGFELNIIQIKEGKFHVELVETEKNDNASM